MTQRNFIERRQALWNKFEGIINGGPRALKAQAAWFPQGYRELTQDLNTARAHGFDPAVIERLNHLVLEGNQLLYGQRSLSLKPLADFILRDFPRAVRAHWKGLGIAHLVFYGLAFFFAVLCIRFPNLVYELMSEEEAVQLEMMYDPESAHFLNPRDAGSDADMFGFYIYNNISIAFRTFAGGILAGFGSLLILCSNGIFLGIAAAHIINKGFAQTFFPFIIGHSGFELTAIILSAQAGLLLGYRFIIPHSLSRGAALRKAGKTALPLISGSVLLLILAAAIEAFWSSRHQTPPMVRYGAGLTGWVLVYAYFLFAGRISLRKRRTGGGMDRGRTP
ncbi:MAG: stage II sporulation protein M [Treponema sp.]|jgi:uncharacterized membrane protein SpoIIM required for sporulation|nr:stage II sporulation protein M [Treponema sp.]